MVKKGEEEKQNPAVNNGYERLWKGPVNNSWVQVQTCDTGGHGVTSVQQKQTHMREVRV